MSDYHWYPKYPGHGPHVGHYTLYIKTERVMYTGRNVPFNKPLAYLIQTPTGWKYRLAGRWGGPEEDVPVRKLNQALAYVATVVRMS